MPFIDSYIRDNRETIIRAVLQGILADKKLQEDLERVIFQDRVKALEAKVTELEKVLKNVNPR